VRASTATDNAVQVLASPTALPGTVAVKSYYRGYSEEQDFWFTITTVNPINDTCMISITFPSYYNPGLNTRGVAPFCSINGVAVFCSVPPTSQRTRTLNVQYFPVPIAASTTVSLHIAGISSPASLIATPENFWIQVQQDANDYPNTQNIVYGGILADTSSILAGFPPV
jgi:hypothetical protein